MDGIKNYFRQLKYGVMIAALISIGIGVLFVALPEKSAAVICTISGIVLLLIGVISIVSYFTNGFLFGSYSLVFAIACIIFGIFCFVRPDVLTGILTLIFGIFLVVNGVFTLSNAIEVAQTKSASCFVLILFAVLSIVGGCMTLFGKWGSIMVFVGVAMIVNGAFDLIMTFGFSGRIRKAQKRFDRKKKESGDNVVDSTASEMNAAAAGSTGTTAGGSGTADGNADPSQAGASSADNSGNLN